MTVAPQEPPPRLDFPQIVRASYRTYASNFTPLLLLALVPVPVDMLFSVLQQAAGGEDDSRWLIAWIIPSQIVGYIAIGALVYAMRLALVGQRPEVGPALDASFARFFAILTSDLLSLLLVALAFLSWPLLALWWLLQRDATIDGERKWWVVLVPFALPFYLLVRWWFIEQSVMLGGHERWAALDESAEIVRGSWWRTFGIVMFFAILSFTPAFMLVGAFDNALVDATVSGVVGAALLPLVIAGETLLYYDLKARKQVESDTAPVTAAESDVQGESPRDL